MPITRKQFDLGITEDIEEWMRGIHEYLAENQTTAFSTDELGEYFEADDDLTGARWRNFRIALMKLAELGAVEKRSIGGTDYYTYFAKLADI